MLRQDASGRAKARRVGAVVDVLRAQGTEVRASGFAYSGSAKVEASLSDDVGTRMGAKYASMGLSLGSTASRASAGLKKRCSWSNVECSILSFQLRQTIVQLRSTLGGHWFKKISRSSATPKNWLQASKEGMDLEVWDDIMRQ
jgi:hypothetical protein